MTRLLVYALIAFVAWRWLIPMLRRSSPPRRDVDRARARNLLGVEPNATRAQILAAHRRLVARVHPDAGGTEALAAEINAARDQLLADLDR